jgi:MoaA/NifB/PqqE/SkfB family radical SAM enzyme
VRRNPLAQRVANRLGRRPPRMLRLEEAPVQPIGAKLELTFACNLRCGFCYTDSPRHTLARTPELDDAAWSTVVDDVIELGVLEAVVTGGEPLLHRERALSTLERLDAAGVATYLNTNGWFIDDAVADRLAEVRGLRVYVSIDGAGAARHDELRGVPGSWRRAIEAVGRLLERGIPVRITHVVTPENRPEVEAALHAFSRTGVPSVHLAPVTPIGAAARPDREWAVDRYALGRVRDDGRRRLGGMNVELRGGEWDDFNPFVSAPATFLVRPDGVVRIGSSLPFSFGHVDEGLAACWERIRTGWDGPDVRAWRHSIRTRSELPQSDLVPYLDEDAPARVAAEAVESPAPGGRGAPRPASSALRREEPLAATGPALRFVTDLALARRYRLGDVRWTEDVSGGRFVRELATGAVTRLNPTAATVMAAAAGATAGDAVDALAARHPSVPRETLVDDTVAALRMLLGRRLLVPALATAARRSDETPSPAAALMG